MLHEIEASAAKGKELMVRRGRRRDGRGEFASA